jgi:filamentous hemagglutinin family protein
MTPPVSYEDGAQAQIVTSITPTPGTGSLGTSVTQVGSIYNITGGTRPSNGTNLFHSFGEFSVGTLDTARFLNTTPELTTSNILGRVTGGNVSSLFGTIDTLSYGGANLFLMNPAGIIFGPNATLNVGGTVTFTSANYMKLADGVRFNAIPNAAADALLSAEPVAAFGFLGSNPGTITVQGSQLTVTEGHGISLVGGNITVEAAAKLAAPSGQINLVSAAGVSEVAATTFDSAPAIPLGSLSLSQGSIVDVSANSAGTIRIRGGELIITDATLSADTVNANGAPVAVDIKVAGNITITDTRGLPAITARTTGTGDAGSIQITSGNLTATSNFLDPNFLPTTLIDSHTVGDGRGGDVRITTGNFIAAGTGDLQESNVFNVIDTGTRANGSGGDVTINAQTVDLNSTSISTGQFVASALVTDLSTVNGSGGNLIITTNTLKTRDSIFETSALFGTSPLQTGGNISITAHDISMVNTQVGSINVNGGGALTIKTDSLVADFTSFDIETISGPGGGITVDARVVELTNGSPMISSTLGIGNAGDIRINATGHVTLIGDLGTNFLAPFQPSGLFSNSFGKIFGTLGGPGNAGNIIVTTPTLNMVGGRINTVTSSSGAGGNVTLNVSNSITISGEFPTSANLVPSILTNGPLSPSGITTETTGGNICGSSCGSAGNIAINTGFLTLGDGGQINSGTGGSGRGGDIAINAGGTISISGTFSDGSPVGVFSRSLGTTPEAGSGGNITLTAGQSVTISDGTSVSAGSTGPGNAGNISINAGQQFEMRNGSVKTEAAQASGGNIDIQAIDRIRLVNSSISTSVLGGAGSGGNITIDPNVVILQNSQIIAQAVQGSGGNISITTPLFLADAGSLVDASSQFGLNGTVNIQSPTSNLAGTISSLPSSLRQVQSLQTGRCAALADSRSSSLIVAGRDILPAEPGGWSPSPFALMGGETDSLAMASPPVAAMIASADAPVSLRRLTPAGFLIQSFAENGLTGCRA